MGCHVGHISFTAFGCADDLLLLIPIIRGLEMLVITSQFLLVNMACLSMLRKQSTYILV